MCNKDQIITHINHLVNLTRNIHLRRQLTAVDSNPKLNFWRVIYGGLLDLAVLEWCKLFGSNGETTHWKELVDDIDDFRNNLFNTVGIDQKQWENYWDKMIAYRNDFIAHDRDNLDLKTYPELDIALESSYYYYNYLIKKLRELGDHQYPNDLREYCNQFSKQAQSIAQIAVASTLDIDESVN